MGYLGNCCYTTTENTIQPQIQVEHRLLHNTSPSLLVRHLIIAEKKPHRETRRGRSERHSCVVYDQMLSRAHRQLNTQAEDRKKKKLSSLSAVERKFFHWENMAYHVCLSSGMGSCRCACKHGDTLARALALEALLRLVRQQVPASVAQLLKKRRLTQKRDTIFNCQTVWIGRKEDLVCAKSIFALTHTVCMSSCFDQQSFHFL